MLKNRPLQRDGPPSFFVFFFKYKAFQFKVTTLKLFAVFQGMSGGALEEAQASM